MSHTSAVAVGSGIVVENAPDPFPSRTLAFAQGQGDRWRGRWSENDACQGFGAGLWVLLLGARK